MSQFARCSLPLSSRCLDSYFLRRKCIWPRRPFLPFALGWVGLQSDSCDVASGPGMRLGALGIVFGAWIFWAAEHASVYGDGSEAGIIAVLIFILALPAIGMMLRYSLREFISVDSH